MKTTFAITALCLLSGGLALLSGAVKRRNRGSDWVWILEAMAEVAAMAAFVTVVLVILGYLV